MVLWGVILSMEKLYCESMQYKDNKATAAAATKHNRATVTNTTSRYHQQQQQQHNLPVSAIGCTRNTN